MRLFIAFLILVFLSTSDLNAQVSCSELTSFIRSEGYTVGSVSSYQMQSDWLQRVTAYEYDGDIYVIASIRNEGSYLAKDYIFCGVLRYNWQSFSATCFDCSYGSRFHSYILDYKCNCY